MKNVSPLHILGILISVISLIYTIVRYNNTDYTLKGNNPLSFDTTKINAYKDIIDTLDRYDYVPFYRGLSEYYKKHENGTIQQEFPAHDSIFLSDSVKFYNAKNAFFSQDREMLHWLLSFRNDTTKTGLIVNRKIENGDTTIIREEVPQLWEPFVNPLLSQVPTCSWNSCHRTQAISLIYAYLSGPEEPLHCINCSLDDACIEDKYGQVVSFLLLNKHRNTETLRELWKAQNQEAQ